MMLGETIFGVTVWAVLPGREPGQRTGLAHLTWGGPGDSVHLRAGGTTDGHMEHYGPGTGTVSGPCDTEADAQRAVSVYLAGLARELAAQDPRRPAAPGLAAPSQPRAAAEATGAAGVLAAEYTEDETARVLAEFGTPERQLEYVLLEAARLRRGAFQAAGEQLDADGGTAAARQRHDVAYEAATARWAAESATAVAWYARETGAAGTAASSGAGDDASPYSDGRHSGNRMLAEDITRRHGGYDDSQWLDYVAGYAEGARHRARETILYAEAVREQAQRNPAASLPGAAQDAPGRAAQQDRAAGPPTAEPAGGRTKPAPAGPGAAGHLDPLSEEYARYYGNGWRASERYLLSSSYQVLTPLERAGQRDAPQAWYDGYRDHDAGRPRWTCRQARLAGFGSAEEYLNAGQAGAAAGQDGLSGGPPGQTVRAPEAARGRGRPAAPRLAAGAEFTGAPGSPLPARRPPGAGAAPAAPSRPRRRQ